MKRSDRLDVHRLIDADLPEPARRDLEERARRDPSLRRHVETMTRLRADLAHLRAVDVPAFRAAPARAPAHMAPSRVATVLAWMRTLRPAGVALATAAAVLVAVLGFGLRTRAPAPGGETPGGDAAMTVRFRFEAPKAHRVAVAGDFNEWAVDRHALEDTDGDGVWKAVVRLPPGRYAYMFVVDDGQWIADPNARTFRDDGFGQKNAILDMGI
jgi:anti-sigma factor RsiW